MNVNSHNPTEHDLNRRLGHEAERFFDRGGAPLELDPVLDRAGEIRRGRRMRATMLMAAAVLAVAVPTALVATGDHDKTITPAPPTKVDTSPLTLQGLSHGTLPKDGYATGGRYVAGADEEMSLGVGKDAIASVARFDGGLMVATRDENGTLTAHFVDNQGDSTSASWPMEGDFAVSDDGNVAAFVEPDGSPVGVLDGSTTVQFTRIPRGTAFDAVAVTGSCSAPDDKDPCAVWVQSNGPEPASWFVTSDAASTTRTEYRKLADARAGDRAAGITDVHDDLSTCSAVETIHSDSPGWTTCGHQLVAFSADGKRVLAMPDGDGLGPTGLAVYDASDGAELLDLSVADQGYVRQMVWEDNDHVLATVYQQGRWAIVRIGLDGSRQYAVPPVAAQDDVEPPFLLPVS
jgi:hypothetical protein